MDEIKNKKLVEDLVNTFNDRDELHEAYKVRLAKIICIALNEFADFAENCKENKLEMTVMDWCKDFVEQRCKKEPE